MTIATTHKTERARGSTDSNRVSRPQHSVINFCTWPSLLALLFIASPLAALQTHPLTGSIGGVGMVDVPPDPDALPQPAVQLEAISSSSIRLTWFDDTSRESGYRVYRRRVGGSELQIAQLGPVSTYWGAYLDTGLSPDTEYSYRVEAYNDDDTAISSETRAFTDRVTPIGPLVAQLRVLTHNVQGLPTEVDFIGGWTDCQLRGPAFGEALAIVDPAYTLVGLQELYPDRPFGDWFTCDPAYILDAARATGRYRDDDNSVLFMPRDTDPLSPYLPITGLGTGGTGLLSLGPISSRFGETWAGNYDGLIGQGSKQGLVFSRVTVPGTDLEIDVYVVHLYSRVADHCDKRCQRGELEQLAHRIADRSGNSGNPVIVMGDFNVPGPPATPETGDGLGANYLDVKEALLDPRDLWLENHPRSNGVTTGERRIDYIFVPTDDYLTNSPYSVFIRNREDVSVVRWGTGFGPVSDHSGVSADIEIRRSFTVPALEQVSAETTQAESRLSNLDQDIEDVFWAYQLANGRARDELEGELEQVFRVERANASRDLISARRRGGRNVVLSDASTTPTAGPNKAPFTTGLFTTVATKPTGKPRATLQNQPFTPHSLRLR